MMKKRSHYYPQRSSIALCFLSCLGLSGVSIQAQDEPAPKSLRLVVVEGEGTVNQVRQKVTQDPIVLVEDENSRPVTGAAVVFTLPVSGPTGDFSNGSKNLTVVTDREGRAAAHGIRTNQLPGKLQIHVNASYRGLTARTLITQFDMTVPGAKSAGGSGKLVAILAIVGAAAAGGAIAATHSGSSSSTSAAPAPPTPIGITPGTGTISPPR